MKATNLRIGNLVNYQQNEVKITALTHEVAFINIFDKNECTDYKNIQPIPITEKHLLDLGFSKEYNDDNSYYFFLELKKDSYCDLCLISGDKNGILEVCLFPYEDFFRFKYLHQIQNLICDLGQE